MARIRRVMGGFIVDVPAHAATFPGSDVRGYGRFGADQVYDVGGSIQMKNKMDALVDSLSSNWQWAKAQILAGNYIASLIGADTSIAGLQTIDNVIALKRNSINDVLGEQITLDKWVNGMQVARDEIEKYVQYVNGNASAMANLRQLKTDLANTAAEFASKAATVAEVGLGLTAGATIALVALAGVILWKVGPDIIKAWASPPRGLHGYARRRRKS